MLHFIIFKIYEYTVRRKRLLILGEQSVVLETLKKFQDSSETLHTVTHLAFANYLEAVEKVVDEIDVVYIAGYIDSRTRLAIYEYLISNNKILYLTANMENSIVLNSHMINISDESMIQVTPLLLICWSSDCKASIGFFDGGNPINCIEPYLTIDCDTNQNRKSRSNILPSR
ncbi:TPA: hypothetical protein TXU88_001637 [Streptococcus suis]|nr:hypothetical protein [Streptococcus suis]